MIQIKQRKNIIKNFKQRKYRQAKRYIYVESTIERPK